MPEYLTNLWDGTHEHGSQIVRAVVIWPCPNSFERLFAISVYLVLVNAVEVLAKNV